jgi:hypothetical protein
MFLSLKMNTAVLVIIFSYPITGSSQTIDSDIYRQLKEYSGDNVRPVLTVQRKKLEPFLTNADKERINDLRHQIRTIILATSEADYPISSGLFPGEDPIQDIFFPFFLENESLMKSIFIDAWQIAKSHNEEIETLLLEIQDQTIQWKRDINSIIQQYNTKRPLPSDYTAKERLYDRHFKSILTPAFFILWSEKGILFNYEQDSFLEESFVSSSLYPNPVNNLVNVQGNLIKPSLVVIKLFNVNGNLLETHEEHYNNAGPIEWQFDLTFYASGTYFIRIATKWDSELFIFEKE